jgi:hypothetical protein
MPGSLKNTSFLMSLVLAACSPSAAIDKMAGEQGKRDAFELADALCKQDLAVLQRRFDPELWKQTSSQLTKAVDYCPKGPGTKRLVGYNWSGNKSTSGSWTSKGVVVATESPGKWTITSFVLGSKNGGPEKVNAFNINATPTKPPELVQMDQFDSMVPMLRAGALVAMLAVLGCVAFFLWRRKKATEQL